MTSKSKNQLQMLLWIMVFDHTSLNITFPVLTMVFFDPTSHFYTSAEQSIWYGLCISIPHLMNLFFTPILSSLSDEWGRKKILLLGIMGAIVFALMAGMSIYLTCFALLILGLLIRGAFSRTNPVAQAIIGDISNKEDKVLHMGYLQGAISLGAFLGPVIGGYFATRFFFDTVNFSLPFFIAALMAGISMVLACTGFTETLSGKKSADLIHHFRFDTIINILQRPGVWIILLILLLSQVSWAMYYQYMPPILKTNFQFSAEKLGLFVGLIAAWLTLATVIGIRLLQRFFSLQQMLLYSVYTIFLGIVLTNIALFHHGTALIWIAAIPTAIGDVIAYSCLIALLSNAVESAEQGKVMGICFIIVALIWALTGVLGGVLMSLHPFLPLMLTPFPLLIIISFYRAKTLT